MNITSMSNRELYKTLTGYDFPNGAAGTGNPENTEFVELNEPLDIGGNTAEPIRLSEIDPEIMQKIKLQKDTASITKLRDSFEYSGGKVYKKTETDNAKTSADRLAYSNDIDFNDNFVKMVVYSRSFNDLSSGIVGGVPTKERIAEYYGKMAKRLDAAYAEGKFTKEEYDYLNEGIAERMEHSAACAEDTEARRTVGYNRSMSLKEYEKRTSMTGKEYQADFTSAVNEYINKYCKIDRTSLMQMFNSIRYGK